MLLYEMLISMMQDFPLKVTRPHFIEYPPRAVQYVQYGVLLYYSTGLNLIGIHMYNDVKGTVKKKNNQTGN